jgi:hypothetical protein
VVLGGKGAERATPDRETPSGGEEASGSEGAGSGATGEPGASSSPSGHGSPAGAPRRSTVTVTAGGGDSSARISAGEKGLDANVDTGDPTDEGLAIGVDVSGSEAEEGEADGSERDDPAIGIGLSVSTGVK